MIVRDAKKTVRRWVASTAGHAPGFYGAYLAGSIVDLSPDASLPPTSDVDVFLVIDHPTPPPKLGKLIHQGLLLDVSYIARDQLRSPERILANYHLAHSFKGPNIIADPSGELSSLRAAVSRDFAEKHWVETRCRNAQNKVLTNLQSLQESKPFPDQVAAWLFAAGVTTHILLVAGTKNPTVRRRYLAVSELLISYDRADFYKLLLALLGCDQMNAAQVQNHLRSLAYAFDKAKTVIKSPFFFASDISDLARHLAIDGSQELIDQGHHLEAIFWIGATYCRCLKIFSLDTPALYGDFYPGFQHLFDDLGVTCSADLQRRSAQIKQVLPVIWTVAQAIMTANPEVVPSAV